ncbi:MAG: hypothetical protein V8R80_08310 [Eubacterium sp.]
MAELDWLYFLLTGLIGIALGAFGSIFNTYASLYQAKDNAFLPSMPIPVTQLLTVRLSGVYVMGLFYQLLVMVPVLIKYVQVSGTGIFGNSECCSDNFPAVGVCINTFCSSWICRGQNRLRH